MRAHNTQNTILVVDDDMFVRHVIRQTLRDVAVIIEAEDGQSAMDIYKENIPDLVFLDIHLPHRSGLEILADIMAFDADAYVVMLSADSSVDNVSKTRDQGIQGFLTKPFSRERIISHLHKCPTIVFQDM